MLTKCSLDGIFHMCSWIRSFSCTLRNLKLYIRVLVQKFEMESTNSFPEIIVDILGEDFTFQPVTNEKKNVFKKNHVPKKIIKK